MNPSGVGLGLNVAHNLVELLSPGREQEIRVTSIPNQGLIFTFFLENKEISLEKGLNHLIACEITDEEISQSKLPSVIEDSETPCFCSKVLIVDDNLFNIMALETILDFLKIKWDSAYSGFDAIEKLLDRQRNTCCQECKQFLVTFMDQEMPQMSEADTMREIKRLQVNIRLIGWIAHKAKEEVDKFLASGLGLCIYKPVSIAMTKDTLEGSLN